MGMMLRGWQDTRIRTLTTLLTLAMMIIIFFFSTENAERSDQRSGVFANAVISLIYPEYGRLIPEEQQKIYDDVSMIIRKTAHFSEYMLLGFLIRICLESWFGQRFGSVRITVMISFLIGVLYAASDELHQMLVDGRSGQFQDVLLDSFGVLSGVVLGSLLIRHTRTTKKNGG